MRHERPKQSCSVVPSYVVEKAATVPGQEKFVGKRKLEHHAVKLLPNYRGDRAKSVTSLEASVRSILETCSGDR